MSKILLIDDEDRLIDLIQLTLVDHDVIGTTDPTEGLYFAIREKPDLIILDLHMPRMQGHEVINGLRLSPRTAPVPVLLISGSTATQDTVRTLLHLPRVAFLPKPFTVPELKAAIEELLRPEALAVSPD